MENFNKLTPAETERLALLMEECAEVQHVIGKILRHGYNSVNPNDLRPNPDNNRALLERELGDLTAAISICAGHDDVNIEKIEAAFELKLKRVKEFLHHTTVP